MYSSIETLRSSLGDKPDLGSVAFILNTQTLYVHTTGCDIVSIMYVHISVYCALNYFIVHSPLCTDVYAMDCECTSYIRITLCKYCVL